MKFEYESALERMGQDADLLKDLCDAFSIDVPMKLDLLEKAIAADDASEVEAQAHSLKGAAAVVGAGEVLEMARSIEHVAANGGTPEWKPEAVIRLAALREAFTQFMKEYPSCFWRAE